MLKAAVIGVGSMGYNHARVYTELSNVQLVAVVDPNPETATKVGMRFSVPHFTDLDTMLAECQPNVVTLAVPTSLHFEVGSKLIEQGIHVLMEKPITSTVAQGEALVALAEKHGVTLAVGHIERFNPAVVELKRKLAQGGAGQIYQIHTQRLSPYPPRIKDAGVVIDLASHDIDLMRYLIQDEIVRAYGETLQGFKSGREDMFNGLLRFRGGVVGVLNVNWITPTKTRTLTITGARGMFVCNLLSQELLFYENSEHSGGWDSLSVLHGVTEGNLTGYPIRRYEPLAAELNDFINAVSEKKAPTVTGRDGLETLRIATEFMRSGANVEIIIESASVT